MTKVDIDLLLAAAATVRNQNNRIRDAFNGPSRAASVMEGSWDGKASQNAMQAFYKLCRNTEPRYHVLDNLAEAMETIAMGYTKTEETNVSLADQFR